MITQAQRDWLNEHYVKDGYVLDGRMQETGDHLFGIINRKPRKREWDKFLANLDRHEASALIVALTSHRERNGQHPDTGEPADTGLQPLPGQEGGAP